MSTIGAVYCHSAYLTFMQNAAAAAAKLLQSCLILCDSIDRSPPGSPVPGILQARTLEWVAMSFSNAWKWKVKVKSLSCVWLFSDPMDCSPPGPFVHGISQASILEWVVISFSNNIFYKLFIHRQSSFPKISSAEKNKNLLQGPTQEHTLYLVVTFLCLLWFGIITQFFFACCDLDFF